MSDLLAEAWFWPAISIAFGLPISLLVLTEVYHALQRRGSSIAKLILLVRNYLVPVGALLVLLSMASGMGVDWSWTRVVATVFGFLVILLIINTINVAVFDTARQGTWRNRVPTIFIEIARVLVIIICVSLLFAFVWGADIGGLFTALGVGSIVIGLTLQNAVGSVVSGLLLLFEQPFKLGDWLLVDGERGRVVEVNWRAVHLDTPNGHRVIPNATLAENSFINLTGDGSTFYATTIVKFSTADPPEEVITLCKKVGSQLPQIDPQLETVVSPLKKAKYEVEIPLRSPGDNGSALRTFRTRLWYAARREELHLDRDLTDPFQTEENREAAMAGLARLLYLEPDAAAELAPHVKLKRYGAGELVQRPGTTPTGLSFIINGIAGLKVPTGDGGMLQIMELGNSDLLGLGCLTRQAIASEAVALTDLDTAYLPVDVIDDLVHTTPELARDIGLVIDQRRARAHDALVAVGYTPNPSVQLIP